MGCIVHTKIPVWQLERARRLGATDEALLTFYFSLVVEDLANAWGYVAAHAIEIEAQIRENDAH